LNDGRIPNTRVARVAPGTGYNRVEGNRRASRNGRVSDLPPEIPNATISNFCIAVTQWETQWETHAEPQAERRRWWT
jgi:hypothetical protein